MDDTSVSTCPPIRRGGVPDGRDWSAEGLHRFAAMDWPSAPRGRWNSPGELPTDDPRQPRPVTDHGAETSARVLLADGDGRFAELITRRSAEGWTEHRVCATSSEVYALADAWSFDVAILDVSLPTRGGLEACRDLRARGYCGRIIVCGDNDDAITHILAFESGADAYFFKARELVLLDAILRQAFRARWRCVDCGGGRSNAHPGLPCGECPSYGPEIDARLLSRLEERLFWALVRARGEVVATSLLLVELWGRPNLDAKCLYDLVCTLRAKLEGTGYTIINRRRKGYKLAKLVEPPEVDATLPAAALPPSPPMCEARSASGVAAM